MSCTHRHTYNTVTVGNGPAGVEDYNGTGGDASISKKVYVEEAFVDQNSINISRDGTGSELKLIVTADYTDWPADVPLTMSTVLNALADARQNSPSILPTYIFDSIIMEYSNTPLNEKTWESVVRYETYKPDDAGGSNSEDNPDNHFTQQPDVTYKGSSKVQQFAAQTGHSVSVSVGYFNQDGKRNATFKKIENGQESNTTMSIPFGVADFSIQKTYVVGTVTAAFKTSIENITGSFNDSVFDGRKVGSVMFAGADYSFDRINKEVVTFKFQWRDDVIINYVRYNHKFFADGLHEKTLSESLYLDVLENPKNIRIPPNGPKLLANANQRVVARGWDVIQFSYQSIPYNKMKQPPVNGVTGSLSVTTGHQVIKTGGLQNFDVLGLGL